jgi:hypothetical protein
VDQSNNLANQLQWEIVLWGRICAMAFANHHILCKYHAAPKPIFLNQTGGKFLLFYIQNMLLQCMGEDALSLRATSTTSTSLASQAHTKKMV